MQEVIVTMKSALVLLVSAVICPGVALAANLDENLIVDPGFESVGTVDGNGAAQLRRWRDKSGDGDDNYAMKYSSRFYGKGLTPPNGGLYHYYGGFNTSAGEVNVFQDIDLSQGDTAAPSALGSGEYYLSGMFTSVGGSTRATTVRAVFSNALRQLGTAEIGGQAFVGGLPVSSGQRAWGQDVSCGDNIPQGTDRVEIQLISVGADTSWRGFLDNVDFRVYVRPSVGGDFDGNGQLALPDVDTIATAIADSSLAPKLDLTSDCMLDANDLDALLGLANRLNGDADFSGDVGFADFVILASNFGLSGPDAVWSKGDFLPDNHIAFTDFVVLSNNFGQSVPAGIVTVPEPASISPVLLAASFVVVVRERGRRVRRARTARGVK